MRVLKELLPHLAIAMLLGMIVLVILHDRNPLMAFLTSRASAVYIIIMCALCVYVLVDFMAERGNYQ